jgi:undecaprenyl-diphosphatase
VVHEKYDDLDPRFCGNPIPLILVGKMTALHAIILGVIQGLTEFLPISSSGHLVVFQQLLGLVEPGIAFEISVHLGTLAAVLIFFRKEILDVNDAAVAGIRLLAAEKRGFSQLYAEDPGFRMAVLLAAGSVPTAIIGIVLQTQSDRLFSSVSLAGAMLIVTGLILVLTGVLLWITKGVDAKGKGMTGFTIGIALVIGIVQGFAIIPGISRSGSTIATGLLFGLDRRTAGSFSFMLSIPTIIGAAGLQVVMDGFGDVNMLPMLIGAGVSFGVGFLSLGFLMRIVNRGRLYLFAPYCVLAGLLVLIVGS